SVGELPHISTTIGTPSQRCSAEQLSEEIEGGIRPQIARLQLRFVSIVTRNEQDHQDLPPWRLHVMDDSLSNGRTRCGGQRFVPVSSRLFPHPLAIRLPIPRERNCRGA